MKTVNLFIISILATLNMLAQENCNCDAIEQENIKLAEKIFQTKTEFESVDEISYICQLSKMPDEAFKALCERYQYNYNFQKQREKNPEIRNYLMFAENENGDVNAFGQCLDITKDFDFPKEIQERVKKIDNTIAMYKDMQEKLDNLQTAQWKELGANAVNMGISILPDKLPKIKIGASILIKKDLANILSKDILGKITDNLIIPETVNGMKYETIDDDFDKSMDILSSFASYASVYFPPARLVLTEVSFIANGMSLFKKTLALGGANLNIYWRKNEIQNYIETLEREKQFVLSAKQ